MIKALRGGPGPKRYRQLKREIEAGRTRRPILTELLHPHRPLEDEGGGFPVASYEGAAMRLVKFIHPSGWERCLEIMVEVIQDFDEGEREEPTMGRSIPGVIQRARWTWDTVADAALHDRRFIKWRTANGMGNWIFNAVSLREDRKRNIYNLWWRRCMCTFAFANPKTSELE